MIPFLSVSDEPDEDGQFILSIADDIDVYSKCGRVWPLEVERVREILLRQ